MNLANNDRRKQQIAEKKNQLESYVYAARGLLRDEIGEEVTLEEEREALLEALPEGPQGSARGSADGSP